MKVYMDVLQLAVVLLTYNAVALLILKQNSLVRYPAQKTLVLLSQKRSFTEKFDNWSKKTGATIQTRLTWKLLIKQGDVCCRFQVEILIQQQVCRN